MIIQYRERMTSRAIGHFKISLEIHLPQLVWKFHLKPLENTMFIALFQGNLVVAVQDGRDGTGRRNSWHALLCQLPLDLAPTPGRMGRPYPQYRFFNLWRALVRTVVGAPAALI